MYQMALEMLFLSKARGQVLRMLFGLDGAPVHVREIERRTSLTYTAIRQELKKLEVLSLVTAHRDGNRLYYSANEEHPLFVDLHRIVLKTDGLVDVLRRALGSQGIVCAFVFGSMARGTADGRSDVDVMVVGDVGSREVSNRLFKVDGEVGREINAVTRTPGEIRASLDENDPFIAEVLGGAKLFVIGTQRELDAVVG